MNYPKIILFLLLSVGLSIAGLHLIPLFMDPTDQFALIFQILAYSWGPALAVIITQKFVYKESLAKYGWNRKRFSFNWMLGTMLLPVGILAGIVGLVFLMGNVFHFPGFGKVVMGDASVFTFLNSEVVIASDSLAFLSSLSALNFLQMPGELWTIFALLLVLGIVAGATINLLFNVGEEVGWRGFMLEETKSLGFLGSNLVIGGLWGLWSIPMLLYFAPPGLTTELIPVIMIVIGYAISVSFPMAYFSRKTRSIYASATFYGVLNNIGGLSALFILDGNPYVTNAKGLVGMLILMGVTYLIITRDKKFVENYKELFY